MPASSPSTATPSPYATACPAAQAGDRPAYGTMTLPVEQFIQRFLMHRLPQGFHRIRHFGILANSRRKKTLEAVARAGERDALNSEPGDDTASAPACPRCGKATVPVATLGRNISSKDLARGPSPCRNGPRVADHAVHARPAMPADAP